MSEYFPRVRVNPIVNAVLTGVVFGKPLTRIGKMFRLMVLGGRLKALAMNLFLSVAFHFIIRSLHRLQLILLI